MAKDIKKVLKEQIELIKPSQEVMDKIKGISENFVRKLKESIRKKKIKAEVFVGGSLAKGTVVQKNIYDVDIFVRFDKRYEDKKISGLLEKVLEKKVKKVHGSRDYYQLKVDGILIEVIPVLKISKPQEAVNVTDLSYFHVNYLVNKIKKDKKLADEIRLAKAFAHAQNCYGAESYIHGFSGYALELLVVYYKSFLKFIETVVRTDVEKDRIIIDGEKWYKNKNEILMEVNRSKLNSPIILIDPTFKERNASSSLNKETFYKFKNANKGFLKNPNTKFFEKQKIGTDFEKFQNLVKITVKTNKQAGDIAGTKSKKFFDFFIYRLKKEFEIRKQGFEYDEEKNLAYFYFVLDKKQEETIKGPPITAVNNLTKFKKAHPKAFIKKDFAYAKLIHNLSFEDWFKKFLVDDRKIMKQMSVREIKNLSCI